MHPNLLIGDVRIAYEDGNHNGFGDLVRFGDRYYGCFRSSATGHIGFDGRVKIISSPDGREWRDEFTFGVENRDLRDPHFVVLGNRLFLYVGSWLVTPETPRLRSSSDEILSQDFELNTQLGYCVYTDGDGSWYGPRSIEGTYGHFVWRAAAYDGRAYLVARRKRDFVQTVGYEEARPVMEGVLLASDDGFAFHTVSIIQECNGNETAIAFEEDGTLLAVARTSRSGAADLYRAAPPYIQWEKTPLPYFLGGPMLVRWGTDWLVGGRRPYGEGAPKTALYWLDDDTLVHAGDLPSGGDTGYPSFVPSSDTAGLLAYYSSHQGSGNKLPPASIYVADLAKG